MTDKIQKIREEIAKKLEVMQYQAHRIDAYKELEGVLVYIDSLQEEPVSEDLEEEIDNYIKRNGYDGLDSKEEVKYIAEYFTKWQKLQDMGITNKAQDVVADVLSSADSPLDAYATEMAFMMLPATLKESYHQTNRDRICDAVRLGAKWQKEHLWKPADGDDLPEYEREVVVFTQDFPNDAGIMRIAIAHRPDHKGWDGKSITTGKIEHYMPMTYGKGGWNIPDVKYWLDCSLPKLEED